MIEPLLKVKNLRQHFKISRSFTVKAVNDVSFEIYPGETYGLVGESGSGKTTIGRSIIRLYDPTDGEIIFNYRKISGDLDNRTRRMLRKNMQMIFQDPMSSLNPRKKIGDIIGEGLDIHKLYSSTKERNEIIGEILKKVGLSPAHAERYPQQFSGGQRQRVGIARALVMNPKLIIADECISALDVSIQAQVVNLMKDIQDETHCAYLFIAHDLSMVKYISDRIGVLHKGWLVETGLTKEIFSNPIHPYTQSLLSAVPQPDPAVEKNKRLITYNADKVNYEKAAMRLWSAEISSDEVRILFEEIFQRGQLYIVHVARLKFGGRMEIFSVRHSLCDEFFIEILFIDGGQFDAFDSRRHFTYNLIDAAHIREMPAALDDSRQTLADIPEGLRRFHMLKFPNDSPRPPKTSANPIEIIAVKLLLTAERA